jgi:hypothetical protein
VDSRVLDCLPPAVCAEEVIEVFLDGDEIVGGFTTWSAQESASNLAREAERFEAAGRNAKAAETRALADEIRAALAANDIAALRELCDFGDIDVPDPRLEPEPEPEPEHVYGRGFVRAAWVAPIAPIKLLNLRAPRSADVPRIGRGCVGARAPRSRRTARGQPSCGSADRESGDPEPPLAAHPFARRRR